jgi:hypothetical protein
MMFSRYEIDWISGLYMPHIQHRKKPKPAPLSRFIILKKALHHEEHRGHEGFSQGYISFCLSAGHWLSRNSLVFFFASFVFFVVGVKNLTHRAGL